MHDYQSGGAGRLSVCVLISGLLLLVTGCSRDRTILIGFVGGLEGRPADLWVAVRDGALLAVEEANAVRAPEDPLFELVIKNDRQDPVIAREVVQELIDEHVWGIVGHMTSQMSIQGAPVADANEVVMISPTTSTESLSGKDDHFFRIMSSSSECSAQMAKLALEKYKRSHTIIIFDQTNEAFARTAYIGYQQIFESAGGKVTAMGYGLGSSYRSFSDIAAAVMKQNADAVFLLMSSKDCGLFSQRLHMIDPEQKVLLMAYEWALSHDLIQEGGHAVEGMLVLATIDPTSQDPHYLRFREQFESRFGREPDYSACHAYDATRLLLLAVDRSEIPKQVRDSLKHIKGFRGLQEELNLDTCGDIHRPHYLMTIQDGAFRRVD